MSRVPLTDDHLDRMRHEADPEADAVMRAIFARHHFKDLMQFVGSLNGAGPLPPETPAEIAAFVEATAPRPAWADDREIERAEHFFLRHGLGGLVALVCASLPECYTMRKGVRILGLTRQLGDHTDRRLHQTAQMVLAVMQPGGLAPGGPGIQQAQRVRLIHAAIRHMVMLGLSAESPLPHPESTPPHPAAPGRTPSRPNPAAIARAMTAGGFTWSLADDGQPINQEDLAYTLLTFGHIIPLAMSRFGIRVSDEDRNAFLHAWNVAGHYIGVRRELMADTADEGAALFERIKRREGGRTEDGVFLTDRLLGFLEQDVLKVRVLRPLGPALVRALAGNDTARMLGLDTRHNAGMAFFHLVMARSVRILNTVGRIAGRFHPLLHAGDTLGRWTIAALVRYTSDGEDAPLAVPTDWLRKSDAA
jgi:hypothetical protein